MRGRRLALSSIGAADATLRRVDRHDDLRERAAARSTWPVRRYPLGKEPAEPSTQTSAADRIAMMWPLALEAWRLAGLPIPEASRRDMPSRILRGPTE